MAASNDPEQALIAAHAYAEMADHGIGHIVGQLRHVLDGAEPEVLQQAHIVNLEIARLKVLVAAASSRRGVF